MDIFIQILDLFKYILFNFLFVEPFLIFSYFLIIFIVFLIFRSFIKC